METSLLRRVGLTLVVLALAVGSAAASQRHKWWQAGEVKTYLGLTDEQTSQIEEIFQSTQPTLRQLDKDFRRISDELSKMIDEMSADEWEITLQIDKVEAARSALSKARTLMFYRMHKVMTAEQRDAFSKWSEQHRSSDRPDSRQR